MLALKSLWRWIKYPALWLLDEQVSWLKRTSAVVLVVCIFGYLWPRGTADDRVRYCGLIFQLSGILIVAFCLENRRRLFNRPSIVDEVRSWLRNFLYKHFGWPKPQIIEIPGASGLVLGFRGNLSTWQVVSPKASIANQIAALRANIESLKTEQAETAKELREEIKNLHEAVESKGRRQESALIDIQKMLDTLGAGGLHLELIGVILLLLGVVCATIPSEIAGLLKWLF